MIKLELSQGHVAIIDDEDAHLADLKWFAHVDVGGPIYAKRNIRREDGTRGAVLLHRVIMGAVGREIIDHINGNSLDCRRSNLRKTDHVTNVRNRLPGRSGTSGFLGVSRYKGRSKWRAYIHHNGINLHLGSFDTPEEANRARLVAEKRLWGIQPRREAAHSLSASDADRSDKTV